MQRRGNQWQGNQHPLNTIPSPKSRGKLECHGQSEIRTANYHGSKRLFSHFICHAGSGPSTAHSLTYLVDVLQPFAGAQAIGAFPVVGNDNVIIDALGVVPRAHIPFALRCALQT